MGSVKEAIGLEVDGPDTDGAATGKGFTEIEVVIERAKREHPEFRIRAGKRFLFRPPKTIIYEKDGDSLLFLHELGHALNGHRDFRTGVERLKMEREAWDTARKLAAEYGVAVNEELIEGELDTYRDWLHQKSRCPQCGLTRFQTPNGEYHCPQCDF